MINQTPESYYSNRDRVFTAKGFIVIIGMALLTLCGCNNGEQEKHNNSYDEYNVVIIDSCQYFKISSYGWGHYTLTHKGNCENPIHKLK